MVLELALTRIFSAVLHYHFVFLAISVALFGLAAGGLLAYRLERLSVTGTVSPLLGRLATTNGFVTIAAVWFLLARPLAAEASWANAIRLFPIYLLCAIPFTLAGAVIATVISRTAKQASRVYFYDLAGAAIGGLLLVPILDRIGAPGAVIMAAACYAASGALMHAVDGWNSSARRSTLAAAILVVAALLRPILRLVDVRLQNAEKFAKWNSFSRVSGAETQAGLAVFVDSGDGEPISTFDFSDPDHPSLATLLLEGPSLAYALHP